MKICDRLLQLAIECGALLYGNYTLSSGKKSTYYFDGRRLSLDPEGAYLLGKAFLGLLRGADIQAIGGPTLGADPIVTAVALTSHLEGTPTSAFIVRDATKTHGTQQAIEGTLVSKSRVAIVDDVCTTASSIFRAIHEAEAHGCTVVKVLAILDRRQGGSEKLASAGYDFAALWQATPEGDVRVTCNL